MYTLKVIGNIFDRCMPRLTFLNYPISECMKETIIVGVNRVQLGDRINIEFSGKLSGKKIFSLTTPADSSEDSRIVGPETKKAVGLIIDLSCKDSKIILNAGRE